MSKNTTFNGLEIAIIGMSGRFPGAKDIDRFWENLKNGVESISFFSDEELIEEGVAPELLKKPNYVKASGILDDIEYFDAPFFGFTPLEAELADPQMRIFHETVWTALEDAGYNPDTYNGLIGLYAGATSNFSWEMLSMLSKGYNKIGHWGASQLIGKDFLPTRVSFNLNLKGPSFSINSACSTSLTAVHLACQAILNGECDIAAAGGVTVTIRNKSGYVYEEGMYASSDGHCKAFDAKTTGIVSGSGSAVVVLKRLEDALKDGDYMYAVIKGSAVNNDGKRKVGYVAPSIDGQVEVINAALCMAEVGSESITYVECHGTGTPLGDPIEIKALKRAFKTDKKKFCGVGSVKSNIGHADSAAGVAGLIKAALALNKRLIPPTLHFEKPNPELGIEESPFYVNARLKEWKNDKYPLRAGVSSFGIGGTNAHVILEEAPEIFNNRKSSPSRQYKLIFLSARTESALERNTRNLVQFLKKNSNIDLADAAYTLQVGRKDFQYRRMAVCSTIDEAVDAFSEPVSENVRTFRSTSKGEKRPMIFMFSGQGSQYVNMGLELYQKEKTFSQEIDRCFEILQDIMGENIKQILYPPRPIDVDSAENKINRFSYTSPIKFAFEYSLAQLLLKWGIEPTAMIGHSFGEYIAACISGVLSLEDALALTVLRGRLVEKSPEGAMLSVPLSEEMLKPRLGKNRNVFLAAVNSSLNCVVSGTIEAIDNFEQQLQKEGYECTRLRVPRAGHSKMMESVVEELKNHLKKLTFNKPRIPYISGLSGGWITVRDAASPDYWARHLLETIRFKEGLETAFTLENVVFVQVGADRSLGNFVSLHESKKPGNMVLNLIRHPKDEISDLYFLLEKIGLLWLYGIKPRWPAFYAEETRYRIPLPTYSFDKIPFGAKGDPFKIALDMLNQGKGLSLEKDMTNWFYIPSWKRSELPEFHMEELPDTYKILVFIDECGLAEKLVKQIRQNKPRLGIIMVKPGAAFERENNTLYTINPGSKDDYDKLFDHLAGQGFNPGTILHLWNVSRDEHIDIDPGNIDITQDIGFYSLLFLLQAMERNKNAEDIQIKVVTTHLWEVIGNEPLCPWKSTLLGPVMVAPKEYSNIKCNLIDILLPAKGSESQEGQTLIRQLITEFFSGSLDTLIAYRASFRWIQIFEPFPMEPLQGLPPHLKQNGVYLITGGLGGIGYALAEYLAETLQARLILTGLTGVPAPEEWDQWLKMHHQEDAVSIKIRKAQALEKLGAEVMAARADVSDKQQMQTVVENARKRFGSINGIIHSAGLPDGGVIQLRTRNIENNILPCKVNGTLVLDEVLKGNKPDFILLCSSLGSILKHFGQVGYSAANAFLDAFAHYKARKDGTFIVSVNWERWKGLGMGVVFEKRHKELTGEEMQGGISSREGIELFKRILSFTKPQIATSIFDLTTLIQKTNYSGVKEMDAVVDTEIYSGSQTQYQRTQLSTAYEAPATEIEKLMATMWQELFGIQPVGINDDFFELGGNSLMAVRMVNQLRDAGINITLNQLYVNSTIKRIGTELANPEKSIIDYQDVESYISKQYGRKMTYQVYRIDNDDYKVLFVFDKTLYMNIDEIIRNLKNKFGVQCSPNFTKFVESGGAIITEKEVDAQWLEKTLDLVGTITGKEKNNMMRQLAGNGRLTHLLKQNKIKIKYHAPAAQKLYLLTVPHDHLARSMILFSYDYNYPVTISDVKENLVKVVNDNSLLKSVIVEEKAGNGNAPDYFFKEFECFSNIQLPFIDVSDYTFTCRGEILGEMIYPKLYEPIDVLDNILFRVLLLKWDNSRYRLYLSFNHLIFDGECFGILENKIRKVEKRIDRLNKRDDDKKDYIDYTNFLNDIDYDGLQWDKYFNVNEYVRSLKGVRNRFNVEDLKIHNMEIDISSMNGNMKEYYTEIILMCFTRLINRLFVIGEVPVMFVSSGRIYKGGSFKNIIGDFHDNVPLLFSFREDLPPDARIKKFIEYQEFIRMNNINFKNLALKGGYFKRSKKEKLNFSSPFTFNSLITSREFYERKDASILERHKYTTGSTDTPSFSMGLLQDLHSDALFTVFVHNSQFKEKKIEEVFMEIYSDTVQCLNAKGEI